MIEAVQMQVCTCVRVCLCLRVCVSVFMHMICIEPTLVQLFTQRKHLLTRFDAAHARVEVRCLPPTSNRMHARIHAKERMQPAISLKHAQMHLSE
jgi:hypothetical protein